MLERLLVSNLLVIREAELEFAPGLNVITGETGAGKTILTGAIGLLLGERGDGALVGPATAEAYVEATFALRSGDLAHESFAGIRDLIDDDGEDGLLIGRRLGRDGRGRVLVAGRGATRAALEAASERLVGIVSQHEARTLVRPAVQRGLLDAYLGPRQEARLAAMADAWRALGTARAAREEGERAAGDHARIVGELRDVLVRVEAVAPEPGEIEALTAERDRLRHASELLAAAGGAVSVLDPDDGDGAVTLAARADRLLAPAEAYDPALGALAADLRDASIRLAEASSGLSAYVSSIEHDGARLDDVEERLDALHDLERRHGSLPAALVAADCARQRLDEIADGDATLARLFEAEHAAQAGAIAAAAALTGARLSGAPLLASAIEAHLGDLAMNEARVGVRVTGRDLAIHGADDVTILLAANPGVAPGPLGAAASGGELSRISLAVRVASLARTDLPTLIFDEVDAGVGGRTALAVAEKLSTLARGTQVICVTHLAQVAARGDRHFRLVKEPGDPTVTRIERLEGTRSDRELARMLGGVEESADALALARSLRTGGRSDAEASARADSA